MDCSDEHLNLNRVLDAVSTWAQEQLCAGKQAHQTLQEHARGSWSSRALQEGCADTPCQLFGSAKEALSSEKQRLWLGRLKICVFLVTHYFSNLVSSLAGEYWGSKTEAGNRSPGANWEEYPELHFPSRESYHVTTTWVLLCGIFSLACPLLLLVQLVWVLSNDHGHCSDLLWHLTLMIPKCE